MMDPMPDSPFAEFAAPKISAAEAFQQRHAQERQARRARWSYLSLLTVASVLSASLAVSLLTSFQTFPLALGFALAGALLGLLVGWLVGAAIWAGLQTRSNSPFTMNPLGTELTRGNSWDKLTIWMVVWGVTGIVSGAAGGALKAGAAADQETAELLPLWAGSGSLIGFVVATLLWWAVRRFTAPRGGTRDPQVPPRITA